MRLTRLMTDLGDFLDVLRRDASIPRLFRIDACFP
jgi:hypothetical protein